MNNSQRTPLILGNWKMHGSLANNAALIEGIQSGLTGLTSVNVGVCVPSVYLAQLAQLCQGTTLGWGAQDCSAHTSGAYTGDVSATMLTEFNAKYVLVGHSERRQYQGETSHTVALKAQQALNAGLTPVVCVGETLAQRQADQTLAVLTQQLDAVLLVLGAQDLSRCVIAYEPVWAIGTGLTATPEQAQTVHAALRAWLNQHGALADRMVLLYGGSMKPDNAASLLSQPDIDGGLIGGAALKAADFLAIIHAAQ